MSKKKTLPVPEYGASTAEEMHGLVGAALSWWESSEDIILGIFRFVCEVEPVAIECFIRAPRHVRYDMLRYAIRTYDHLFEGDELDCIEKSLKQLEKLTSIRNEIAHGNVVNYSSKIGDRLVNSRHYLLPSFNESGYHERNFKFHHAPDSIANFVQNLRLPRGVLLDVFGSLMNRTESWKNFAGDAQLYIKIVRKVARLEVREFDSIDKLKDIVLHIDSHR